MQLAEILAGLEGRPRLMAEGARLARLAGREVGPLRYFTAAESRAAAERWLPATVVPVGEADERVFALDLQPAEVEADRCSVVEIFGPSELLGTAAGLVEHARLTLAREAARARMEERSDWREVAARPGAALEPAMGEAVLDAHALPATDEILGWLWAQGARGVHLSLLLRRDEDPAIDYGLAAAAAEANPASLYAQLSASGAAFEADDWAAAAGFSARSLGCQRYLAGGYPLDAAREAAVALEQLVPGSVDPQALAAFCVADTRGLARLVDRAKAEGRLGDAARLALDLGFERGEVARAIDTHLRPLFSALGWRWALALCDLRQGR